MATPSSHQQDTTDPSADAESGNDRVGRAPAGDAAAGSQTPLGHRFRAPNQSKSNPIFSAIRAAPPASASQIPQNSVVHGLVAPRAPSRYNFALAPTSSAGDHDSDTHGMFQDSLEDESPVIGTPRSSSESPSTPHRDKRSRTDHPDTSPDPVGVFPWWKESPMTSAQSDHISSEDEYGYGANQPSDSDEGDEPEVALGGYSYPEEFIDELFDDLNRDDPPIPDDDPEDMLGVVEALDIFGYGILSALTKQEAVSLSMFLAKIKSKSPREGYRAYQEILDILIAERPVDIRTIHAMLERKTGVRHIRYQVCENNCYCFAENPNAEACPICGEPRPDRRLCKKTFDCIDIIHLLRLKYSHAATAARFQVYRKALAADSGSHSGELRDIWDGKLIRRLQEEDMLNQDTDLAFFCSTDGVNLFRRGRQHSVWPIVLVNYNLSPDIRFRQENITCFGVVPGPKKPKDFSSFLYPLVQQFKALHRGVPAIDGSRLNAEFRMRAYIVAIGADMPAKDMLMGLSGHSAKHYCNYCLVRGVYSQKCKHMYAPLRAPASPEGASENANPEWRSYNADALPLRDHETTRMHARHVEDTGDAEVTEKTGVKNYTVLLELPSIIFPWSFGIDSMHLFYLNIAQYMRDHWLGTFTPNISTMDDETALGKEEPYQISGGSWREIEEDINQMVFPVAFGDKPRSILAKRLKAAEWKTWVQVVSPIVLRNRLAEPYYSEWMNLVEAMTTATGYSISKDQQASLHAKFVRFVHHYEAHYYQYDLSRVAACKTVFHALLHVGKAVEWLGPMWSYSQWVMERTCGLWTPRVKLKKAGYIDRHLSLVILHDTQIQSLPMAVRLDMLSDSPCPHILKYMRRQLESQPGEEAVEEDDRKSTYRSPEHQASLHTRAGEVELTFKEVRALVDMLNLYDMRIPEELNAILRDPKNIWRPTKIYVRAYKHLRTNDRHVENVLSKAYVRSKRFEPGVSRDATFVRLDIQGQTCFGRVHFFFLYEIEHENEIGGEGDVDKAVSVQMFAFYDPIRVFLDEGVYRVHASEGDPASMPSRRLTVVDVDQIVGLVGIVYNGDGAFFVCRDSCFL